MKIPEEIKDFFNSIKDMALATSNKDNIPNVVAIGSQKTVNNDSIWVIDTYFNKTKENILQNNKVAIVFWKKGKGYQIKGLATYYSEGNVFEEGKKWILTLKPDKIVKGVVEIKVTDIFDISPSYDKAGKRIV